MKSDKQTRPNPPLKGERPSKSPLKGDFFSSPLRGGREGSGSQRGSVELLSPARNLACGIAAIDHGADAVYIGASRFGARAAAGNSIEDIKALCDYAHRFGAKVYVTVNTLLRQEEREQARLLIWDIYRAGADAIIVQDMFFCSLPIGKDGEGFPPIPLHASTQMDNRTAEKVAWLNGKGFEQVVLARELTLEEIQGIHQAVPQARLEVFVHGALCVSYSGRCYASEYCFGRSANRGECAQFCRLPFSLQDAEGHTLVKDKYLLSLRDMNRIGHLEEMMDAGVRSFKIEGRLKDIAYVKNVTAAYRQAIDAVLERRPEYVRSSFGTSAFSFQPDLSRSFSRGCTDYFLFGRTRDLASPDTPKSRGRQVGSVKEVRRDCIVVSSSEVFSNGDGLCYFDAEGHLQGFRVNRAEGNHLYFARNEERRAKEKSNSESSPFPLSSSLKKGDRLWRSYDKSWENLMEGHTAERRIAACFLLEEAEQGFRLTFSADDGTCCSKDFALEHQPARTDQTASIKEVLGKLGDTPYVCKDVEVRFSLPWFIPRSTLAEWRRQVTAPSENIKLSEPSDYSEFSEHSDYSEHSEHSENSEHSEYSEYSEPSEHSEPSDYSDYSDKSTDLPPLMTCRFCLRHAWGQCKKATSKANENPLPPLRGKDPLLPFRGNEMENGKWLNGKWQDPLFLVLGDGRRFRLAFDCKNCEMTVNSK